MVVETQPLDIMEASMRVIRLTPIYIDGSVNNGTRVHVPISVQFDSHRL